MNLNGNRFPGSSDRPFRRAAAAILLFAPVALVAWSVHTLWRPAFAEPPVRSTSAASVAGQAPVGARLDPARVMGYQACKNCHRSETLAWLNTPHYLAHEKIRTYSGNVQKYCEALGLSKTEYKSAVCAECHATRKHDYSGNPRLVSGVSCESCHGASGGEDGWLNRHAVYGPNVTPPEAETAGHRKARLAFCDRAGMVRAVDLYQTAKSCLRCHAVRNETLVNAGHKPGDPAWNLVGRSTGAIRHNFHQDQSVNAEAPSLWAHQTGHTAPQRKRVKLVVGILAEVEVCLNALANVKDPDSDYAGAFIERTFPCMELLGYMFDFFEDDPPEPLIIVLEGLEELELDDADFSDPDVRAQAAELAEMAGEAAREFAKRDGSKLAALDEMIEEVVEVIGEPYTP